MIFIVAYQMIAFALLGWIFIMNDDNPSNKEKYAMIGLSLVWPITIVLMVIFASIEAYKHALCERATKIFQKYGATHINQCAERLTLRELKYMLWCERVGAYIIDPVGMDLVQQRMATILFEKDVLGVTDGKTKS